MDGSSAPRVKDSRRQAWGGAVGRGGGAGAMPVSSGGGSVVRAWRPEVGTSGYAEKAGSQWGQDLKQRL